MALTTFEEEIYLRALTGRVVGRAIADLGANKVAVVAGKNIICSSIATATEAAFLDKAEGRVYHFLYEDNAEELASRLLEYGPELTLIQFGGESSKEEVIASFKDLVKALARKQLWSDLLIHVRTFAAGAFDEALKDEEVKAYLSNVGLYVYTVDFDKGLFLLNEIVLDEEAEKGYHLTPILEYSLTLEHVDLLNRSLKDRRVAFSKE